MTFEIASVCHFVHWWRQVLGSAQESECSPNLIYLKLSKSLIVNIAGSLAGVRNESDAKLLSEKQRQIADLQNQLKSLVS